MVNKPNNKLIIQILAFSGIAGLTTFLPVSIPGFICRTNPAICQVDIGGYTIPYFLLLKGIK